MPISSHQVSGMIGGQQAMFGNFASYAQQISPGGGQGPMPTYSNPMAGVGAGPATPFEDQGEFGAKAMSAIGNVGLPALGTAAMIGGSFMPGAMGRAIGGLDPMSAGLSGFARGAGLRAGGQGIMANLGRVAQSGVGGIARAGIGGIAGGMAAAAAPMAIGAAAQYGVGQMVQGAQYENQVGGFLQNNFRFANQGSETGYGFGREQRGQISGMMREMGHSEAMSSPGEMMNIMKAGTGMGVFRAVQDAKQFKEKFKEMLGALKEVATTMNTTLEGAVPFFSQARQQGFWTPQDITRNAQMARQTAGATGMSVAQTQQMMGQGAQMARSVGALGAHGAEGMSKTMNLVGGAVRGGVISEQQLSEATGGLQGAEAIQALSGSMQAATTRFSASTTGRWMLAGLGKNNFQGLDTSKLKAFARGDIGIGQIGGMARGNIAKQGAFNFVQNEEELRGELIKQGPAVQMGVMAGLAGKSLYGESSKDKYITRRMMKRFFGQGISSKEADARAEMLRNAPQIAEDNERRSSAETDNMARDRDQLMNTSWDGVKKKASKWWDSNVKEPLQKLGADVSRRISTWWEHTTDKLWGATPARHRLRGITEEGLGALQSGMLGNQKEMETVFGKAGQMEKSLGRGGTGLGFHSQFSGGLTGAFKGQGGVLGGLGNLGLESLQMGERTTGQIQLLGKLGVGERAFKTEADRQKAVREEGYVSGAYRGGPGAGAFRAMKAEDVERAVEGVRAAQSGILGQRGAAALGFESEKVASSQIAAAQKEMGSTQYRAAAQDLQSVMQTNDRSLGVALVKSIEAKKMGGDNLRKLLAGAKDMTTKVNRLAAAQSPEGRRGRGRIDLADEARILKQTDLLGLEEQAKKLGERTDEHVHKLAEAMAPEEVGGLRGFFDPSQGVRRKVSIASSVTAIKSLSDGDNGPKFRKAMMLMSKGDKKSLEEANNLLAEVGEHTTPEEARVLQQIRNNPEARKLATWLGVDFQDKNRLSFMEVIKRRRGRMMEGASKLSEGLLDTLDKVQSKNGKESIGGVLRELKKAETPEQYVAASKKLMDVASRTSPEAADQAAELLEETGQGEFASTIRHGSAVDREVAQLTKKGGKPAATASIFHRLGIKASTQDVEKLRRGDKGVQERILSQITDAGVRDNTKQIIEGMKKGDETALRTALLGRHGMLDVKKLSDKEGLLTQRKKMENTNSLEMGQGTTKGMHAELIKMCGFLKTISEKKPEAGSDPAVPKVP